MKSFSRKHLSVALAAALLLIAPAVMASGKNTPKKKRETAPGAASAAKGKAIFKLNCNMCHNPDKNETLIGPGLKDLFKNKDLPASHKPVTEEYVRAQIERGSPESKPMPMPPFAAKLSSAEIENLIAYLRTL